MNGGVWGRWKMEWCCGLRVRLWDGSYFGLPTLIIEIYSVSSTVVTDGQRYSSYESHLIAATPALGLGGMAVCKGHLLV